MTSAWNCSFATEIVCCPGLNERTDHRSAGIDAIQSTDNSRHVCIAWFIGASEVKICVGVGLTHGGPDDGQAIGTSNRADDDECHDQLPVGVDTGFMQHDCR